ncbi:hypothetical protein BX616_004542 [Lobosporangium transversale]|uniref:DIS3-like exonuclease 2 n=1 Tax=Lobosporangium transversale TaxID=64571 RepID=A0A1Y2GLN2_9FUNG|nr:hypothetical protein BCR41DRAFT_356295 [Lobosporangium transversale]KAF9916129.1 hypothetical protein BX616_004542 [Lobosporangium transversale]ORZ12565.1 hypothetical protein BCR41DRAFT_356295 [Lobosporangium transversale]|eukprot:XP_021880184.1 hypothetical protein BCR41DRAFT_356295 [Lobosporangium transversale]
MSRESSSSSSSSPSSTFTFAPATGVFPSSSPSNITAPTVSSAPSSRRSSILFGDKFGRIGSGLPTVNENDLQHSANTSRQSLSQPPAQPESQPQSHSGPPPAGSNRRGSHVRSKSMKEQLDQFGQSGNKDNAPKTLQSLQEIISSLKSIPANHNSQPSNVSTADPYQQHQQQQQQQPPIGQGQGLSRHEKRSSMSSLPSRSSMGYFSTGSLNTKESGFSGSGSGTTTTLHISQPPRGTSIENALQSTVATLRRLSVSDSKRPVISTIKKDDDPTLDNTAPRKTNNRRSIVLPQDIGTMGIDQQEISRRNRRSATGSSVDSLYFNPSTDILPLTPTTPTSGYQPNRRSVIIRPEEVAALQEGRTYVSPAAKNSGRGSYSSDEEADAIADTLSALEGKASMGHGVSYSSKAPHRRSISSVDPNSLAEFAAKLPNHMQPGTGSAAFQNFGQSLVNNDDARDRRRYSTSFNSTVASRSAMTGPISRRLSAAPAVREADRKEWRISTSLASNTGLSNRDSVSLKENANGRRPLFQAHLTYSDFHSLLTKQKHKYVQGVLRINKRNRSDAYVTVDSLPEGDVYICGSKDRNRALEGDVVGIELIDFEDVPIQKLEGGKDKKKNKRAEDVEEAGEADVEDIKPKYCGRVVSIVERSLVQMFSGTLTLQRPSGSAKKNERRRLDDDDSKGQPRIVWFKPTDKRVPLIAIPIDQAPRDFVENHMAYAHKLFLATIKRWPLSSLHPFGHLERELGDIGNIEIETEALLADNNVTTTAFGEKVEKCLPELPWVIPEKELSNRRDLRKSCTFTIDPATAKDLDDAVSCIRLEDGTFEIGVHIADVSHFIKVGSALDREAKARATTVYLVQKAIPMLPTVLSEDLCSLTVNVDRLTFSVFWIMTESGEILKTSFAKSVIRSCAQLSYDDAQRVITTGALDSKVEVYNHPREVVEENIKTFFKLSMILRQKRFDNGALSINSIKLAFETDGQDSPLDVTVLELKESNRLIEEFMLLANMSVAKQIFDFFPEQALLRRHEGPLERRMGDFIQHMNKIGLELDASSAGALQASMDAIQDPDVRKVVHLLANKPMHRGKYICSGMLPPSKYHHYALNAPLYTHFTSPIRRYADIIVHRLLEASLTGDSKVYLNKEACQKCANHCNLKKDAAKLAEEQSSHLYLSVLLRKMTEQKGMVIREGIVVQILDTAFDVMVTEFGLEKRVHLDQLPLERYSWNESTETLKLYWSTQPFKTHDDIIAKGGDSQVNNRRLSMTFAPSGSLQSVRPSGFDAMGGHPDDATNAYDDERGLFDDDSFSEDDNESLARQPRQMDIDDDANDELANNLQKIKMFGRIQVLITPDTSVSPPAIKVVAINPFAAGAL